MFSFHWHLPYLAVAILAAGAFDFYCSRLLHARYGKQFGAGFVGAGLVSFSLPTLLIIGVPVYLILASGLELSDRLMMLGAILLCCLWSGWRLRHRLLSRVFSKQDVEELQARAVQERAEREAAEREG